MEPRSAFVHAAGVRLHYMDWGQNGPPLVLAHGGRRTSRSWDVVVRQLCQDFWIIALDAKGHGDSDKPSQGYAYHQRVSDFEAFLTALGLEHAYGMGHSAGAITMALHAERHPGRLQRLLLIEPLIIPRGSRRAPRFSNRLAGQRRVWSSRADLKAYLRQHPDTRRWREDVLQDVVQHEAALRPDGSVEMKWSPNVYNSEDQLQDNYNLVESAPNIQVPTLLMYGTESFVPRDPVRAFAAALPHGGLEMVEGAGHNIYMETPDLVAEKAHAFFLAKSPHPLEGAQEGPRESVSTADQ